MIRFSLYVVLLLVAGAALVNGVARDPGYLLVAWGSWQVETSVWLALGTLCIGIGLLWLLQRALNSTLHAPAVLARWLGGRSERGAQQHAEKGLVAFLRVGGRLLRGRCENGCQRTKGAYCSPFLQCLQPIGVGSGNGHWRCWINWKVLTRYLRMWCR
jgi:uncharacterized membrane-anchored protein